jgi:DNA-directed RNA polymerase specialized sigma24 family protein
MKTLFSNFGIPARTTDSGMVAVVKKDDADTSGDIELLDAISMGDRYAFSCFYDRYAKLLFSIVHRILNDKKETENVLQEVFGGIWDKAGSYHSGWGRPVSWAVALAQNKAIDVNRTRGCLSRLMATHPRKLESAVPSRQRSMN